MIKASFSLIEFNNSIIAEASPSAEDFCEAWINYLVVNGWTEEEFLAKFEHQTSCN